MGYDKIKIIFKIFQTNFKINFKLVCDPTYTTFPKKASVTGEHPTLGEVVFILLNFIRPDMELHALYSLHSRIEEENKT